MAKYRPVRPKPKATPNLGAVPCLVIIIGVILLMSFLFYAVLSTK